MLTVRLAWAMLEVHRYSDALQILQNPTYEPTLQPEKAMAQAVAYWQAQLPDDAMIDFNSALAGQPEWRNADWVKRIRHIREGSRCRAVEAPKYRRTPPVGIVISSVT